jgi:RNA recognition motif-containing protein
MLTIDVRGLPRSMTETSLQQLFAAHGRVFDLRMAKDLFSGECKGFAELKMEGHEARNAIEALNGSTHNGAMIRVALHTDRKHQHGRR